VLVGNVAGASVPYLLHQRPGKISWQWLVGRLESLWRSLVRPPFNLGPPDLGCVLVMHAAIGLMMGLFLFALVMIVMNLAAFGVPITGRRAQGTAAITKQ
jgi:hypothetical protein